MSAPHRYLVEVQGLRTVAALLVAVYHVWLHRVSGGVDVLLVVAGYFLVAGLARREPLRLRHLAEYYGATARRVLPGAALVILATVLAAWAWMPDALWRAQIVHAFASLLFVENWWLAREATDYLQQGLETSPFQQMWALSLQMQVYFLFPVIYLVGSAAARLLRGSPRLGTTLLFGALALASFVFSVSFTNVNQPVAYFISLTRLWEFAAGALLALWIGRFTLSPPVAKLVGWAGLFALVALGAFVDVSRQFPGYLALVPVAAALAIIVSASNGGNLRLLNNKVMTGAADMSFAFYLWHWPLLVFLRYRLGSADVGLLGGLAVLVGAAVLAYASTRFLEQPLRRWTWLAARPLASIALPVLLLLAPAAATYAWSQLLDTRIAAAREVRDRVLADPALRVPPGTVVPAPVLAREDRPGERVELCDQSNTEARLITCVHGDPDGATTIVAVGGSHVSQWMRTLNALGKARGYRIVSMVKDDCTFTTERFRHRSCAQWNTAALEAIITLQPDLVFAIATRSSRRADGTLREVVPRGYREAFAALAAHDIPVLALRDNPWFPHDVAQCVSTFAADPARCGVPLTEVLLPQSPAAEMDAPNVVVADFTELYCSEGFCPAVRNGILLYRDRHHLTGTFAYLQSERLGAALSLALNSP